MKILKKLLFPLLVLFSIGSLILFTYPTISNCINEYFNESNYEKYTNSINNVDDNELNSIYEKARKYNEAIALNYFENFDNSQYEEIINSYNKILDFGNGLIGYIEIPKINIKIPIYHELSNDETALSKGAVHLEETSFPIGGANTHSAISAHSGYPAAKFFDDIDTLENGDYFYIYVLNKKLKYEVYDNEIVEPSDTSSLDVIKDKDIVTLVTCYPYGINSHRLLVHAEQVSEKINSITEKNISYQSNNNTVFIVMILIIYVLVFVILIIIKKKIINKINFK